MVMSMEWVIRDGQVADGTGGAVYRADVRIGGGRIIEIGPNLRGENELSAEGAVVAPGFIDIHTHYDAQILWDPLVSPSCWQGVTSVVIGNCGFGIAPCRPGNEPLLVRTLEDLEDMPREALEQGIRWDFRSFPEYLSCIRRSKPLLNIAAYIGHTPVRLEVMGEAAYERTATEAEIGEMAKLVANAMQNGAIGFATSSAPTGRRCATRLADEHEIVQLLLELKKAGRGVAAFVPGGPNLSHRRLYELQHEIGRPFTWTALLTMPTPEFRQRIEIHKEFMKRGADVHPQVTCRPLIAQTTLRTAFALRTPCHLALEKSTDEVRLAAYSDSAWRQQLKVELKTTFQPPQWHKFVVVQSASKPQFNGLSIMEMSGKLTRDPVDCLFDLAVADRLDTRFQVTLANDDEAAVRELLVLKGTVMGLSDAGAHPDQICDAVMPVDLLANWVRGRNALSLEAAVHKLTGEPAAMFGLDRGLIKVGMPADITVFVPDAIGVGPIRRVRDLPAGAERLIADQPTGIRHVFVNGVAIRTDGRQLDLLPDARPGEVLAPAHCASG